jgi:hypothetical protein
MYRTRAQHFPQSGLNVSDAFVVKIILLNEFHAVCVAVRRFRTKHRTLTHVSEDSV